MVSVDRAAISVRYGSISVCRGFINVAYGGLPTGLCGLLDWSLCIIRRCFQIYFSPCPSDWAGRVVFIFVGADDEKVYFVNRCFNDNRGLR